MNHKRTEVANNREISAFISQPAQENRIASTNKIIEERNEFTFFVLIVMIILFCCIIASQLVISILTRKQK